MNSIGTGDRRKKKKRKQNVHTQASLPSERENNIRPCERKETRVAGASCLESIPTLKLSSNVEKPQSMERNSNLDNPARFVTETQNSNISGHMRSSSTQKYKKRPQNRSHGNCEKGDRSAHGLTERQKALNQLQAKASLAPKDIQQRVPEDFEQDSRKHDTHFADCDWRIPRKGKSPQKTNDSRPPGDNQSTGERRICKKMKASSPPTDNKSAARQLFDSLTESKASDCCFVDQYLVVCKNSLQKLKKKSDFEFLSHNDGAFVVARNPQGQIYFATNLHLNHHFTINPQQKELISGAIANIKVVEVDKNELQHNFAVWNVDSDTEPFLKDIAKLIKTVFSGFQTIMKMPSAGDKRGTISTNIGLTATDCRQYPKNRTTILETVRPFLTKLDPVVGDESRAALGELVLYIFKKILPKLNQQHQFKLPNTKAGKSRSKLRHGLASLLHVGETDYDNFRVEAISIIIPIIVHPHTDSLNDSTSKDHSGTITVNCSLPLNIVTNATLLKQLKSLGYTDTFPCSIILYARKCCGSFYKLMCTLQQLEQGSNVEEAIVESIEKKDEYNPRDYIGNIFNNHNIYKDSFHKIEDTQGSGKVEIPYTYDIMSRWSIVLDMMLDIHFYLGDLKAGDTIMLLLSMVLPGSDNGICRAHKMVMTKLLARNFRKADAAKLYTELFDQISSLVFPHKVTLTIQKEVNMILEYCHKLTRERKNRSSDAIGINDSCRQFRDVLVGTGLLERAEANDFIQLATVTGFIPLHYISWLPHNSDSDIVAIANFTSGEDRKVLQQNLVQKMRKEVSLQITGPFLYNLLASYNVEESDLLKHFYYYQWHRESIQHFFRLKFDSHWVVEMLRDPQRVSKTRCSKTVTLSNWKDNDDKYIHWKTSDGCAIDNSSCLVVPENLKKEFFNDFEEVRGEPSLSVNKE